MRKPLLCVALLGAVAALSIPAAASAARPHSYVVLLKHGTSAADTRAAIRAAGGTIVPQQHGGRPRHREGDQPRVRAAKVRGARGGVARNRVIGRAPAAAATASRGRRTRGRGRRRRGGGGAARGRAATGLPACSGTCR